MSQRLADAGIPVVPLGQGFASLSSPTKELQGAILRGELEHDGSPLLRWQATNTTVISDNAGNIKPVKADRFKRRRHIDSIVAGCMAMDGVMRKPASISGFLANPIGF